jgi:hypothetical protein
MGTRAAWIFLRAVLVETATGRGEVIIIGDGPGRQSGKEKNRGVAQHGGDNTSV